VARSTERAGELAAEPGVLIGEPLPAVEGSGEPGLVSRLVAPDEVAAAAEKVAADTCSAPNLAIQLTKRSVDVGEEATLDNGIRVERMAIERNLAADG